MLWLKYQKYRRAFKEVLHEERILDEVRKREAIYTAKLNRQQKQVRRSAVHVVKYFNKLFENDHHKSLKFNVEHYYLLCQWHHLMAIS